MRKKIYSPGVIVFIARSKQYPNGHFLSRVEKGWMDPWINFSKVNLMSMSEAKAGIRKRLPGRPIYAILPEEVIGSAR